METKFNESRTFGVEIEFLVNARNNDSVANWMTAHGVECQVQNYNHRDQKIWKIVTDSSAGYELVSPPLKGEEGFNQLKVACDALKAARCKVDRNCGLHVHQDAHDLNVQSFKRLYFLYIRYEGTIDSMMPKSRRGNNNQYCGSMRYNYHGYGSTSGTQFVVSKINQIKKAKTVADIDSVYCSRYKKLNAQSYIRHGTIEFRQHAGTVEFEKIRNWVILTNLMVEKAKTSRVKSSFNENFDNYDSFKAMMNMTAAKGADEQVQKVAAYYEARIKELKSEGGAA